MNDGPDDAAETAARMAFLFGAGSRWHARWLRLFSAALRKDEARAQRMYGSLAMWGGAGSVADFSFSSAAANRAHWALMVQLHDQLAPRRWHHPRAETWVAAFRAWLSDGAC